MRAARHLVGVAALVGALAAVAGPAAGSARLVPIDPRLGPALAMDDRGWIVGRLPEMDGSSLGLWRNRPLVRLPAPPGRVVREPAWFGTGGAIVATANPPGALSLDACGVELPVLYLPAAQPSPRVLEPPVGGCNAWATGFAGDHVVGLASVPETADGLVALGWTSPSVTTRNVVRAVTWGPDDGVAGGAGPLAPAPIVTGSGVTDARALFTNTRVLAGNSRGDLLLQRSTAGWRPFDDRYDAGAAAAIDLVLRGATHPTPFFGPPIEFARSAGGPVGLTREAQGTFALADDGRVLSLHRSRTWRVGGQDEVVPFAVAGMSPTGRIVGNARVDLPGAATPVTEARGWFAGRVTDIAALARAADPAHADLIFGAEGPINRRGSIALSGCPRAAFETGGFGRGDSRCRRFRLDLTSAITGTIAAPAPFLAARAAAPAPSAGGLAIVATDGTQTERAVTDRAGSFRLELPAGTWRLSVGGGRVGCLGLPGGPCRAQLALTVDGAAPRRVTGRVSPPGPAVALAVRRAAVRSGSASLRLTCRHVVGCRGRLVLAPARGAGRYGAKSVVLRFGTQTVRVPLAAPARAALAAAGTLAARATLAPAGGSPVRLGALTLAG